MSERDVVRLVDAAERAIRLAPGNVARIEAALKAWGMDSDDECAWNTTYLAGWLAASGVLAVDSISDEDALSLPVPEYMAVPEDAIEVRAALRRLATGEPE